MNNNNSIALKFIAILFALVTVILSIYIYKLFRKFNNLNSEIKIEQQQISEIKPTKEIVEKIVTKVDPWSELQPKVKDTVVQIFSQIGEFNWLEPYKTPNQSIGSGSGF